MKSQKSLLSLIAICLFFLLFSFTCRDHVEGGHTEIQFINNSDNLVDFQGLWAKDTLFFCGGMGFGGPIESGKIEMWKPGGGVNYWETLFKGRTYIQIFVFSESFGVEICNDGKKLKEFSDKYLLQRYQLTKEDLDRMNWTVIYPPEE